MREEPSSRRLLEEEIRLARSICFSSALRLVITLDTTTVGEKGTIYWCAILFVLYNQINWYSVHSRDNEEAYFYFFSLAWCYFIFNRIKRKSFGEGFPMIFINLSNIDIAIRLSDKFLLCSDLKKSTSMVNVPYLSQSRFRNSSLSSQNPPKHWGEFIIEVMTLERLIKCISS